MNNIEGYLYLIGFILVGFVGFCLLVAIGSAVFCAIVWIMMELFGV